MRLSDALAARGMVLRVLRNAADLRHALNAEPRAVVVLFTEHIPAPGSISALAHDLSTQRLVCVAPRDDLALRLEALRAGAAGLLTGAVLPEAIVDAIEQAMRAGEALGRRILIVDDSPLAAKVPTKILQAAGFEVEQLTDELKTLSVLAAFEPELIILDLHMPKASGAELAALIREQPRFALTPIIYLSDERDPDVQRRALRLGGDELLNKPVAPDVLVEAVNSRLHRSVVMRARLAAEHSHDPITGLANRAGFLKILAAEMDQPRRRQPGNGLVFLTIDQGDRIAKATGVGGGDALMARAAALLHRNLLADDQAARFGIYSFMVLAQRDDDAALMGFAEHLYRAFGDHSLDLAGSSTRLSVNIGLTTLDLPADDALTLIARCERACRAAGETTGRRLLRYSPQTAATDEDSQFAVVQEIEQALEDKSFPIAFEPMIVIDAHDPTERYLCGPALEQLAGRTGVGYPALMLTDGGALCERIDRRTLKQGLQEQSRRLRAGADCRVWVRQSMRSLRSKDWLLRLLDYRRRLQLAERPLWLVVSEDDLLANLSVAAGMFQLLKTRRIGICIEHFSDERVARSLLDDYPIAWLIAHPECVEGNLNRLAELVSAAHARGARVIARIADPDSLTRILQSGVDLAHGAFVQSPEPEMCYDFGGGG